MGKIIIGITLIIISSCKVGEVSTENPYKKEILGLTTVELKKAYLDQIFIDDQKVRGSESQELLMKYGKDSNELRTYYKEQWRQDSINVVKVEQYFKIHGYPKKALGEKATTAPWLVIHHAQGYEVREENFGIIYKAYLDGDIDDTAMSFYLGRMYQMKNGERLKMLSPFKSEDEINTLIEELDLIDIKVKIQNIVSLNYENGH